MKNSSKKILLLSNSNDSNWTSVAKIRSDIVNAYRLAFKNFHILNYNPTENQDQLFWNSLKKFRPDRVVFVDANPHPNALVHELSSHLPKKTEYAFHIYGNVPQFAHLWNLTFEILKGRPTRFYVASQAQHGQLSSLLNPKSRKCIITIPFPVEFKPSSKSRQKLRRQFRFSADDFVLTYVGRISAMKNLDLLIVFLAKYMKTLPKKRRTKLKLLISGDFDDIGGSFFTLKQNEFYSLWTKWLKKIPPSVQSKIQFLGHQPQNEIAELYCACDLFVSLSTFHDEDFGRAPIESLICGTPVLLTNWGGFKDINGEQHDATCRADSKLTKQGPQVSFFDFKNYMNLHLDENRPEKSRSNISQEFTIKYRTETYAHALFRDNSQAAPMFYGGSSFLKKFSVLVQNWRAGNGPLFDKISIENPYYRTLYKSYYGTIDKA